MASKRGVRRRAARTCSRKDPYPTAAAATERLQCIRLDPHRAIDPEVRPYLCPACHQWHLGHPKEKP